MLYKKIKAKYYMVLIRKIIPNRLLITQAKYY